MSQGVEHRTKIGVAWVASMTVAGQLLTFTLGVVLARILMPEDFGVFASIFIFTEVATSIVSSGIVTALIQRPEIHEEHYSTALVMQIGLAIIATATLVGISPLVGYYYQNALVGKVLMAMSLYLLMLPFISIPTAMLRKRIDFRSTSIADIMQQIVNGSIAIILAISGWGVWSLVVGRLSSQVVKAVHLAFLAKWLPTFRINREAGREIGSFGMKVVGINTLNDIANNVDYVLVGRLLGQAPLGFYYRAYHLMTLPLNRVTTALNTVLFSAFSEVQKDVAKLKRGLLKSLCYVSLVTFPLLTCLFWVAPSFVHTVYGAKWMASVAPLRIMCFAGMLLSLEPIAVSAIIARGFVGVEMRRQLVYVLVLVTLVPIGGYWGIEGVSVAVVVGVLLFAILLQQLLRRLNEVQWREMFEVLLPAVGISTLLSLVVAGSQTAAGGTVAIESPLMLGISLVGAGGACVAGLLLSRRACKNRIALEVLNEVLFFVTNALRKPFRRWID